MRIGRCPALAAACVVAAGAAACRRRAGPAPRAQAEVAKVGVPDARCVTRPEGCIWCQGRGAPPAWLDAEDLRPLLCNPRDSEECVEFCSRLTPDCALPWQGSRCLLPSEDEFRRALFWRDNGERPEAILFGRIVDEGGKRVEGARVRVWLAGTPLAEERSGKDGTFRMLLRSGPWKYTVQVAGEKLATEILDLGLQPVERLEKQPAAPRVFRLGAESQLRGRVVDDDGDPVGDVTIQAVRTPEDSVSVGETRSGSDGAFAVGGLEAGRRYYVRASRFGWESTTLKSPAAAPSSRVVVKLVPTGVIRGAVIDADGDPEPNATVLALLSGPVGSTNSPILRWTADSAGRFAEDRFGLGTYYLWARRGDMLAYPPQKVELSEDEPDVEVKLALSHRGARIVGRVVPRTGQILPDETHVILHGRSPLAFPRDPIGYVARDGRFSVTGVLPGPYELGVRGGTKALDIVRGPREVEIPIEAGSAVELGDPVVVQPQLEE